MNGAAAAPHLPIIPLIIYLVIMLFVLAAMWQVFTKAGKPGWAIIVPIYNVLVLLDIAGKPAWWIVLFLIPGVNAIMMILVSIAVAQRFEKGAGFGIGLVLLPFVFYPILGFGGASYAG